MDGRGPARENPRAAAYRISVTANQRRELFGCATTLTTAGFPGTSFADGTVSVKVPYSSVVGSRT